MSSNPNLNLHFYDTKINHIINEIQKHAVPKISLPEMNKVSSEIHIASPLAGKMFDLVRNDFGRSPNYDPVNRLRADDLLPFCIKMWESSDPDFRSIMVVQLEDLNTGTCPQGRCVRCCQIIWPFFELLGKCV